MSSSSKRRAFDAFRPALAAAAALFGILLPLFAARAAGCPSTPVAEHGGQHWCIDTGSRGHVHLWKPDTYQEATAVSVVYVHGYNNDESSGGKRLESGSYIDRAWDKHGLAAQFAASRLNALFIAPEGPIGNADQIGNDARYAYVKWNGLAALLTAVQDKGAIIPPSSVTAIGHSAGMFTVHNFFSDARLKHVMALDSMYADTDGAKRAGWLNGASDRKLTLVGGQGSSPTSQNGLMAALSRQLGCAEIASRPSSLDAAQVSARCLYVDSKTEHMAVVTGGQIIPVMLARSGGTASGGAGGTAAPAIGGTASGQASPDADIEGPALEIPIPGVNFTDAIRRDGTVTIPWLAQYVGGVYTFLISIAGMLAAVMMVVGGFQYVTAAGDKGRIGKAKKRITDALTGLVLALGSYTILYAINPELVAFDGLKVASVRTDQFFDATNGTNEGGLITATEIPLPAGGSRPSALCTSEASCRPYCDKYFQDPKNIPQVAPGMASPNEVEKIPNDIPGVNGFGNSTSPTTIALLRVVGPMFAADGFKLAIGSAYRDLRGQFKLACEAYRDGRGDRVGRTIANPGGSFHGVGYAIDVTLWKDGKQITMSGNSDAQQQEDPQEARYLAEKMLQAGFRRLNNEIWHFEPANAPATNCRCYKIEDCTLPPNVRCP